MKGMQLPGVRPERRRALGAALEDCIDLAIGIAMGSATQIALFGAPPLVFLSYTIGPQPMDLVFAPPKVVTLALAVLIVGQVAKGVSSSWRCT